MPSRCHVVACAYLFVLSNERRSIASSWCSWSGAYESIIYLHHSITTQCSDNINTINIKSTTVAIYKTWRHNISLLLLQFEKQRNDKQTKQPKLNYCIHQSNTTNKFSIKIVVSEQRNHNYKYESVDETWTWCVFKSNQFVWHKWLESNFIFCCYKESKKVL